METRRRRKPAWGRIESRPSEHVEEPAPHFACNFCHQTKVKCSGHSIPCTRCAERSLPCRPREPLRRGRKRASGDGDGGGHGDDDDDASSAGQPVLDLVLTLANPKGDAELYLRCFHRLHAEGLIDRARVLAHLRGWRTVGVLCGTDPTWGIAPALCDALKISPLELEDPNAASLEPSPAAAKARAEATMAQLMQEGEQLRQSLRFRQYDDGATPLTMYIYKPAGTVFAPNDPMQRLAMTAADSYQQVIQRRICQFLLFAAVMVPQDREVYMTKVIEAHFSADFRDERDFLKAFYDGEVRLYHMKVRRLEEEEPGCDTVLFSAEPVPRSRHITDQPGIFHTVVKQYRHYGNAQAPLPAPEPGAPAARQQQPSSSASSSSTTAATGLPHFPTVAALPVSGPAAHETDQLCCDPQRLAAVFPLPSRAQMAALRPPRPLIAEAPPLLNRAMGPPQSGFAPSPAGFRITPPPLGGGEGTQGGEGDVPLLDEEMFELLEQLDDDK